MKKNIIIILILIVVAVTAFTTWYLQASNIKKEVSNYNSEYEKIYQNGKINGVDLTTIINKAVDNNEKYSIGKDENNVYIDDGIYYTEIYIKIVENKDAYPMEAIQEVGLSEFTRLYGSLNFECTKTEYHENGRISKLTFEIIN